ncbi:MAG: GH32 C-terminal domain-containing protein, partial [Planctomycetales bacterium]|nr:GH32 C-terminal domain-containing protein [Planctomycetales bacterium]
TGGNRDPKVIWHEPTQRWVMVLYVEQPAGMHTVQFFTSPDLREWTLASVMKGDPAGQRFLFECPDFFELPVEGNSQHKQWVLTAADSQYAIGSFDGKVFEPTQTHLSGHLGRGFYAAQTFSDIPATDGRRIQIGWFQTETRGAPFNQSMTIPLELKLVTTADGPRMTFTPVRELESLRSGSHLHASLTLGAGDANPLADIQAELLELRAEFDPSMASEVVFNVRGSTIRFDREKQELIVNDHRAPAPLRDGKQRITIYCDRTGLEVFASDGLTYVPLPYNAQASNTGVSVRVQGAANATDGTPRAQATFSKLNVYELRSAWSTA